MILNKDSYAQVNYGLEIIKYVKIWNCFIIHYLFHFMTLMLLSIMTNLWIKLSQNLFIIKFYRMFFL